MMKTLEMARGKKILQNGSFVIAHNPIIPLILVYVDYKQLDLSNAI